MCCFQNETSGVVQFAHKRLMLLMHRQVRWPGFASKLPVAQVVVSWAHVCSPQCRRDARQTSRPRTAMQDKQFRGRSQELSELRALHHRQLQACPLTSSSINKISSRNSRMKTPLAQKQKRMRPAKLRRSSSALLSRLRASPRRMLCVPPPIR